MSKIPDEYDITARYMPTALCALPILILYHYYLLYHFGNLFSQLDNAKFLGYVTLEAAAMYLVMQLNNRLVGKILQRRIFQNKQKQPTTQLLMLDDTTLSTQTKLDIAAKFKSDFGQVLPIKGGTMSEADRRKRITELTSYMRDEVRDIKLVKNHNIEYGFVRNLCGGSFGAILICLTNVFIFCLISWSKPALIASLVLLIVFLLLAVSSRYLITTFGSNYATVLFEQYLSKK